MSQNFILLNPFAKAGNAQKFWHHIASDLPRSFKYHLVLTTDDWESELKEALKNGTQCFIAAGGDGTVNALLNSIIHHKQTINLESLNLGAIGLGSSNDFHKPYKTIIHQIPIKIHPSGHRRDVLKAEYLDDNNVLGSRYFIVSGSIGLVAEANLFFNSKATLLSFLKRQHTSSAILYAAVRTLLQFKPIDVELLSNKLSEKLRIINMNVLKSNYISGSFHVDLPISVNDGHFTLALTHYMSRLKTLVTLVNLTQGKFKQNPYCNWWSLDNLEVNAKQSFALELDGETILVKKVRFSVFTESIQECQ